MIIAKSTTGTNYSPLKLTLDRPFWQAKFLIKSWAGQNLARWSNIFRVEGE